MKTVRVAVGVITRENEFYLTRRLEHLHQGGKWEFPGGKVEEDESVAQALARELKEEVAIDVLSCIHLIDIEHDYGDKKVVLYVYLVDQFNGEPKAQEGQQEEGWFNYNELKVLTLPAANAAIVDMLDKKTNI